MIAERNIPIEIFPDFGSAPNPFLVYRFKLENHELLLFYTDYGCCGNMFAVKHNIKVRSYDGEFSF